MNRNRPGFAALMLLVVVAIGFLIYYFQFASLGGPGARNREKPQDQPWARESSLKDPNTTSKPVSKESARSLVRIYEPLHLQGPVMSSPDQRGTITINFDPNGTVTGTWACKYSYTHAAYAITADFTGNTDPTVFNNGPDGKPDRTKLIFVARGNYSQHVTNLESGEKTLNKGTLYVNGILTREKTASGKVSLTGNKNWHVDYTYTAQ